MNQANLKRARYWARNWRKVTPGHQLLATFAEDLLCEGAIYTVQAADEDYVYLHEVEGGWCWWRFEDHDKVLPITPIWEFPYSFEEYLLTYEYDPYFSQLLLHWRFKFPNCYGASVVCDNPNRALGSTPLIRGYELLELYFTPSDGVEEIDDPWRGEPINQLTADDVAETLVKIMSRPHRIYG